MTLKEAAEKVRTTETECIKLGVVIHDLRVGLAKLELKKQKAEALAAQARDQLLNIANGRRIVEE